MKNIDQKENFTENKSGGKMIGILYAILTNINCI